MNPEHPHQPSTRDRGNRGEELACAYLERNGFTIVDRNVSRKTGELDIVARRYGMLHVIEVKAVVCHQASPLPGAANHAHGSSGRDVYHPAFNLHPAKLRKVARTTEWYIKDIGWSGEWQIDAVLVWICDPKRIAHVEYLPRIL